MVSPIVQDLFGLDRDVARAVAALAQWRAGLRVDSNAGGTDDPFEDLRHVAARSTCQELAETSPSAVDLPLRDALIRWVAALVQSRIGLADEVARARAMAVPAGRFLGDPPRRVTWREAWGGLVAARSPAEAHLWLTAAADCAEPLAAANRARSARRVEISRRMGRGHPLEPLADVGRGTLQRSAMKLLDATEDVSRATWKEALRFADGPAARLYAAAARDAGDGWPARLTPDFFDQTFGDGPRGLPLALPPLPQPLGAASFARALSEFGLAVRAAASPSSLPFTLGRDPAFVQGYRLGFVFGSLPADVEFHVKGLGLGRRKAYAQSRILARTALLEARLCAARVLLGDDETPAPADLFAELGMRVFGAPLDVRLRGAWPDARDDEPARWVGLLDARSLRDALRERFDVDWFRNPHAWSHLREPGSGDEAGGGREPMSAATIESSAAALGRAFEEALG